MVPLPLLLRMLSMHPPNPFFPLFLYLAEEN